MSPWYMICITVKKPLASFPPANMLRKNSSFSGPCKLELRISILFGPEPRVGTNFCHALTHHAHCAFFNYAFFALDNSQTVQCAFWDEDLAILRVIESFIRADEDFKASFDDVENLVVQFVPVRSYVNFLWDVFGNMDACQIWTVRVQDKCLHQSVISRVQLLPNLEDNMVRTIDDPGATAIVEGDASGESDIRTIPASCASQIIWVDGRWRDVEQK